jgi:hypothetical protein
VVSGLIFLSSYSIGFGEGASPEFILTAVEEAVNFWSWFRINLSMADCMYVTDLLSINVSRRYSAMASYWVRGHGGEFRGFPRPIPVDNGEA